jgi:hypothetical protein
MLLDLFTHDKTIQVPVNDIKDIGLIWRYNYEVPFGFAKGVYRSIGRLKDGKKKIFATMQEYVSEFEKEIDVYFKNCEELQPMFDAQTEPDKKPRPLKTTTPKAKIRAINDESNSLSDMTTSDSLSVEVNALGERNKMETTNQACFKQAIFGDCNKQPCKYSHDPKTINEYKEFLKTKLS